MNDLTGQSTKFRDIREIMKNPTMKAKLGSYIEEAMLSKTAIATHQGIIKKARENALDELGVKPAVFNQYLAMVFNNDYVQRKGKFEELVEMIEYVMEDQNLLPGPRAESDD